MHNNPIRSELLLYPFYRQETKAKRAWANCPRSHSYEVANTRALEPIVLVTHWTPSFNLVFPKGPTWS